MERLIPLGREDLLKDSRLQFLKFWKNWSKKNASGTIFIRGI